MTPRTGSDDCLPSNPHPKTYHGACAWISGCSRQCISSTDVSALRIIDCVQLPNNISCMRECP
jgi:hypothetical protein